MPFIKTNCPTCNKPFESVKEFQLSGVTAHFGKCGHVLKSSQIAHKDARAIESLDGKKLFKFQAEGVDFLETSNGRALIADEMGLGKTVQVLGFFVLHPEALKALYVVKKSLTTQWQHENMRWIGENEFAQIISDSKTDLLPFAKYYIISYDLVSRIKDFKEKCEQAGVKTIVLDECQQIKNPEANRSVAIRNLCRMKTIEHIIALSGTPIKNRASEYFTVLNILHPEIFSNLAGFTRWWCQSYWDGHKYVTGGLANPELFKEKTKSFIIRRERTEVMPDLPRISRNFSFHELGKEVEKAYVETLKSFQEEYNSESGNNFEKSSNILAYLSKMRHLTGLSKIDPCIDFIMEFLGSTDRKLTVFVHHKDVGEILLLKLKSLMAELELAEPLQLVSSMDGEQRSKAVNAFMSSDPKAPRILIASTLASGEGLNLQKCSDCIMLERQWNPANEEQAEGRFIRIGQLADAVTATYFVAVGTVDEFFSEIVEKKRQIVTQTLGGEAPDWDESSLIKELSEILATRGGQRWGL
jgi:SWI/SNF-related matrix-associated actin-dependent regulator 1 of chromatin subfamily A